MSDHTAQSRLNRKSFIANSIFFLPAILFSISLGRAQTEVDFTNGMIVVAQIVSLILTAIYIRFTFRRLHDAKASGWFSFALIPPLTVPLLIYLFVASNDEPNKWGEHPKGLVMFGIRAKGWRIFPIVLISILLLYLAGLFATFFFDKNIY